MKQGPRLWTIAGVQADDRLIALDQFEHITKAQWCELFYHLYQEANGQSVPGTLIVDDIRERREVIESHCEAMGPLGKR